MSLLKKVESNLDIWGFIAQLDSDGGDSAQREGMFIAAASYYHKRGWISTEEYMHLKWRFLNNASLLISNCGLIRRHPDTSKWYGDWDRGSRDQYHFVIGASLAQTGYAKKIFRGFAFRGFLLCTNLRDNSTPGKVKLPDFTGPQFIGVLIRCLPKWAQALLKPVLHVLDLSLVIQSLIWVYYFGNKREESDILNHLQTLLFAEANSPTFSSRLAARILRKLPKWEGIISDNRNAVQQRLDDYFNSHGGVSGLAVIYEPIVKEVIYGEIV